MFSCILDPRGVFTTLPVNSRIWTKYEDLFCKSLYLLRPREIAGQKKLQFWTLLTEYHTVKIKRTDGIRITSKINRYGKIGCHIRFKENVMNTLFISFLLLRF